MAKKALKSKKSKAKKMAAPAKVQATKSISSKPASKKVSVTDAMQLTKLFAGFFLVNVIVVGIASMLLPDYVVLGNHLADPWVSLAQSMLIVTFLGVGAMPVIELVSGALRMKLSSAHWMAAYLVINAGAIWIVAKFAEMLGLGISSWMVALALAAVMDYLQGLIVKNMD